MEAVRKSPWAKLTAAFLMLALAFSSSWFGYRALTALSCVGAENWQQTGIYYVLLRDREGQLAGGVADAIQLERNGESLSYLAVQSIQESLEELEERMDAESTWFRFQVKTADGGQVLATNLKEGETLSATVSSVWYSTFVVGEHFTQEEYDLYNSENDYVFSIGVSGQGSEQVPGEAELEGKSAVEQMVIECGLPLNVDESRADEFYQLSTSFDQALESFRPRCTAALSLMAASLLCLLFLLWSAGHKEGKEEIILSWQDKIFLEFHWFFLLTVGTALAAGGLYFGDYLYQFIVQVHFYSQEEQWVLWVIYLALSLLTAALVGVICLALRTLVVRVKAGALARTTLLCRVVGWTVRTVHELIVNLPFIWKVLLGFLIYFFANVMLFTSARYNGLAGLLWFGLNGVVFLFLAWWAIGFHRLRKGSRAIAAGDLEHQIDTNRMFHDLRLQAEDLNNISVGLSSAVDEKMKSERFQAELITNVSHDLKTPLTSIINYVNLLKTTEQTDPKAQEYIEVLDRKSQRLKKLTEDLVEASKASTGVLSVSREKIGMVQLIDQALGEWEEKLAARHLTVVRNLQDGETWVYADGRHLWRVIDNLLSNCAKYAMEGTRIYLDLERGHGQVVLSVKNISREALNVAPERLMERFVRGDESRTTEGSGLGLSIARSLTELQGGIFQLKVDGDLFKACITLPQAN